jgi:hypothetical protein
MATLDQHQDSIGAGFGFGEAAGTKYRGQVFDCGISGNLVTLGFDRDKGSKGIKVYFDTVDGSNLPVHNEAGALYAFTIPNASVINGYGEYALPVPLALTSSTRYCFYLAPWDTGLDAYADDYADCHGINSISGGVTEITKDPSWRTEGLTFHYATYMETATASKKLALLGVG